MSNFLLLGFCLIAGMALRKFKRLPAGTPQALNHFVFHISFPALILLQIHSLVLTPAIILPVATIWILFVLSALFFGGLGSFLKLDRKTTGTLILMGGLSNTSFVGFPVLTAIYGPRALETGVLVDQLGTFLVLSSLGIAVASLYSSELGTRLKPGTTLKIFLKRVFSFPPVYALLLALVLRPVVYPDSITELLSRLGDTLTPLALVSVGFQFKLDIAYISRNFALLNAGLFYKLVLGPAAIIAIYLVFLQKMDFPMQVAIAECAMAPMITAAILVSEYKLNEELANLMLGIGIPLSLVSVPLWSTLLNTLAG